MASTKAMQCAIYTDKGTQSTVDDLPQPFQVSLIYHCEPQFEKYFAWYFEHIYPSIQMYSTLLQQNRVKMNSAYNYGYIFIYLLSIYYTFDNPSYWSAL